MGIVEPYGEKKTALVAAGKVGHKIALIGQRVFGHLLKEDVSREDTEIHLFNLPGDYDKIEPLSNYTLVKIAQRFIAGILASHDPTSPRSGRLIIAQHFSAGNRIALENKSVKRTTEFILARASASAVRFTDWGFVFRTRSHR